MTEEQGKAHEADFRRLRRSLEVNAHANTPLPLRDFQEQAEAFWNHPYAKKLREDAGPTTRRRPTLAAALKKHTDRLQAAIAGGDEAAHHLRRSWTLKDGALIDISGDDAALPAEERLVVVTSSSTITTDQGITSYVVVNVFERDSTP